MSVIDQTAAWRGERPIEMCPPVVQLYDLLLQNGRLCESSDAEWFAVDFGGMRTWQSSDTLCAVLHEFEELQQQRRAKEAARKLSPKEIIL